MLLAGLVLAAALTGSCKQPATQTSEQTEGVLTSERSDDELVVCISGMVTPQEGMTYYQGLSQYVADKAGKKLRLIHKAEYAELNELLRQGEVDMAFSCSGPYVSGHDEFGLELLCAPVVNGEATYRAYIIVPTGSTATSLDDLKGTTFAFTDPDSNTGCIVPRYMLALKGTTPEEFFGRVVYLYSHDNSIRSVAEGEAAGASVDSLIYDYASAKDPTYTSRTRIIETSPPYGIPPVVVRPGLDRELKQALQDAFLGAAADARGGELLANMGIERFVLARDDDYDSVREMTAWIADHETD